MSLFFSVHGWWDDRPDAARYLLAAQSLAAGDGYTVMGEPFRLRPPGFSLALAPLVAWRGFDFGLLNIAVSLTGVAAAVLFFYLMLPRLGALLALAGALVVWLNPQLQALANQVMSDVPSLALALLALLAMRHASRQPSLGRDVLVVLAIAAAVWVRTANVLLLPAFFAERACRLWLDGDRDPRTPLAAIVKSRFLVPAALFAVLYLPWALQPSYASQYDSPDLYDYSTAFLRQDPNDPTAPSLAGAEWLRRIGRNADAYASTFASGGATRRPVAGAPLIASVGLLALVMTLVRRREAPEWFGLATLLLLLGYYVSATRLLLPVFVLTIGAIVDTVRWIVTRLAPGRTRAAEWALVAILALVALLGLGSDVQQARDQEHYASLLAAAEHLRATVPPDAPLGGDVGAVYALLLDRPVYSLRPISRRKRRHELFELIEQKKLVAMVARTDGPLAPVLERMAKQGGELVVLPHHVVLHLSAPGAVPRASSRLPASAAPVAPSAAPRAQLAGRGAIS